MRGASLVELLIAITIIGASAAYVMRNVAISAMTTERVELRATLSMLEDAIHLRLTKRFAEVLEADCAAYVADDMIAGEVMPPPWSIESYTENSLNGYPLTGLPEYFRKAKERCDKWDATAVTTTRYFCYALKNAQMQTAALLEFGFTLTDLGSGAEVDCPNYKLTNARGFSGAYGMIGITKSSSTGDPLSVKFEGTYYSGSRSD